MIGKDRTGSGKTLAFCLPALERLRKENSFQNRRDQSPMVIVIVPTRELAIQVTKQFKRFKNSPNEYREIATYGGTPVYNDIRKLNNGADILVGTPGRIMDLQDKGVLKFHHLKYFILDETDQMLKQGFQEDIEKILKVARDEIESKGQKFNDVQFLLFSATVPRWVEGIAKSFMKPDYKFVDMIKNQTVQPSKTVKHLVINFPNQESKINAIGDILMVYGGTHSRTIIFCDKKKQANDIHLNGDLKVENNVLHGEIPQKQREVVFETFRNGNLKCLIATNVAARGLDIPKVDLIIQLTPPQELDSYIHRSGRTGRAGKSGVCITLVTKYEENAVKKIEHLAKIKIQKVGMPQIADIMKANARDIKEGFTKVEDEVLPYFKETVDEILTKFEPA